MNKSVKGIAFATLTAGDFAMQAAPAGAATASELEATATASLKQCFADVGGCKAVGEKAKGILVFPEITQAAVGIGGSYGEGVLMVNGKPVGFYSLAGGSVGLQLGAQKFSQVVMFMTKESLAQFQASSGWTADAAAGVTWIDQGASEQASTMSQDKPVIGFAFGAQGLMGAAAVGGAKITPFTPEK